MATSMTWQKAKMEKHKANGMRRAKGSYARFAPVPDKAIGGDRRDGGDKERPTYETLPAYPLAEIVARSGREVSRCKPGKASGTIMSEWGKGRAVRAVTCRGNGERTVLRGSGLLVACLETIEDADWPLFKRA